MPSATARGSRCPTANSASACGEGSVTTHLFLGRSPMRKYGSPEWLDQRRGLLGNGWSPVEGVGVQEARERPRFQASGGLVERPEDILPVQQAVREVVKRGLPLGVEEGAQVHFSLILDRRFGGAAPVQVAGRLHKRLRAGVDAGRIRFGLGQIESPFNSSVFTGQPPYR